MPVNNAIQVLIGGDITGLQRVLRQAEQIAGRTANDIGGSFADVAQASAALWAGAEVVKGGVTAFAELHDQLLNVKVATKLSEEQMGILKARVLELGGEPAQTPAQVAAGFVEATRAGQSFDEAMVSIVGNAKLAAGSEFEMGEAVEYTTDILGGFGESVDQTNRLVDVLIGGGNSASITISTFADELARVGPIAESYNQTIEKSASALLVLANAGLKEERAAVAYNGIWRQLIKNSDELATSFGVQVHKMENGKVVFRELSDIVDELNASQFTAIDRQRVFGDRAGPAMAILLKKGGDAMREYEESLLNAGGTADRVSTDLQSGVGGSLRTISSDLQIAGLKIGEFFVPALNSIADVSSYAGKGVDFLTGTFKTLGASVTASAAVITKGMSYIAAVPDFIGITDNISGELEAISNIAKESALNLVDQAGAAFDSMKGKTDSVVESEEKLSSTLQQQKNIVREVADAESARVDSTVDGINQIISAEERAKKARADSVKTMFESIGAGSEEYYANEAQKILDQGAKWQELGASVIETEQWMYDEISALSSDAWGKQHSAAGQYLDDLTVSFTSATNSISSDLEDISDIEVSPSIDTEGFDEISSTVDSFNNESVEIKIDADTTGFDRGAEHIENKLDEISEGGVISVDMGSLQELEDGLQRLSETPTLDPFGVTSGKYQEKIEEIKELMGSVSQDTARDLMENSIGKVLEVKERELEANKEIVEDRLEREEELLSERIGNIEEVKKQEAAIFSAYKDMAGDTPELMDLEYFKLEADALARRAEEWKRTGVDIRRIEVWLKDELTDLNAEAMEAGVQGLKQFNDSIIGSYNSTGVFSKSVDVTETSLANLESRLETVKGQTAEDFLGNLPDDVEKLKAAAEGAGAALAELGASGPMFGMFEGMLNRRKTTHSFAGGGYTWDGSRSGGLDGMGGELAIMHPNEITVDLESPAKGLSQLGSAFPGAATPATSNIENNTYNITVHASQKLTSVELDNLIRNIKQQNRKSLRI